MRKPLERFTSKLQEGKNFQLRGEYKDLANVRGALSITNSSVCNNAASVCVGTNSNVCSNSGDGAGSTDISCINSASDSSLRNDPQNLMIYL